MVQSHCLVSPDCSPAPPPVFSIAENATTATMGRGCSSKRPPRLSLLRLVVDQTRITPEVINSPYPGTGSAADPFVVTWIEHDSGNPLNWSSGIKWLVVVVVAFNYFAVALCSSTLTGSIADLQSQFRCEYELAAVPVSLFVLGSVFGPFLWAPLSELYGRRLVFIATFGTCVVCSAACALSDSIPTLALLRFLAGVFGATSFSNSGITLSDILHPHKRGIAMSLVALAPSAGPTLGPSLGGFISGTTGSWRWTMVLNTGLALLTWLLSIFLLPETYGPIILRKRSAELSQRDGKSYVSKIDMESEASHSVRLKTSMIRPVIFLWKEPIVTMISLYIALIYGIFYLLLNEYQIAFQGGRGWLPGIAGLSCLGMTLGMLLATPLGIMLDNRYEKVMSRNRIVSLPEKRLAGAMIGACTIPVSLLCMAWTISSPIIWVFPIAAGVPFGFGLILVRLSTTHYLVDTYQDFSASAVSSTTILKSIFGTVFPPLARKIYNSDVLRKRVVASIPGFLALAFLPLPFILQELGPTLRVRSRFSIRAHYNSDSVGSP